MAVCVCVCVGGFGWELTPVNLPYLCLPLNPSIPLNSPRQQSSNWDGRTQLSRLCPNYTFSVDTCLLSIAVCLVVWGPLTPQYPIILLHKPASPPRSNSTDWGPQMKGSFVFGTYLLPGSVDLNLNWVLGCWCALQAEMIVCVRRTTQTLSPWGEEA